MKRDFDFTQHINNYSQDGEYDLDEFEESIIRDYLDAANKRKNHRAQVEYIQERIDNLEYQYSSLKVMIGVDETNRDKFLPVIENILGELKTIISPKELQRAPKRKIKINEDYSLIIALFDRLIDYGVLTTSVYRVAQLLEEDFKQKDGKKITMGTVKGMFHDGVSDEQYKKLDKIFSRITDV